MIRITLLAPLLGLTAFGGYYRHWDVAHTAQTYVDPRDPLAAYAHRDGQADAERDLARGERRLLTYGEPVAWQTEYSGMLARVYRIELKSLAAGDVNTVTKDYVRAYNSVMLCDISRAFGAHSLTDTKDLAQQLHTVNVRIQTYVPPY